MYPINISFEWDRNKASANFKKHGVSFSEAVGVFYDPNVLWRLDHDHSLGDEERESCLGLTERGILLVIYAERHQGATLRIISARRANKRERHYYYENQTPAL